MQRSSQSGRTQDEDHRSCRGILPHWKINIHRPSMPIQISRSTTRRLLYFWRRYFGRYVSVRMHALQHRGLLMVMMKNIELLLMACPFSHFIRLGPKQPYLIQVGQYNQDNVHANYEQFIATIYIPFPYFGVETTFFLATIHGHRLERNVNHDDTHCH